jgi:hypothetical protein
MSTSKSGGERPRYVEKLEQDPPTSWTEGLYTFKIDAQPYGAATKNPRPGEM